MFRLGMVALGLLAAVEAAAQDPIYSNLSFTGDGRTPSAVAQLDAAARGAQSVSHVASASAGGIGSWGMPLPLPPGILAPALAISWSSARGTHTWMGHGFDLQVGLTISRPTGHAATAAYADVPGVRLIAGDGLDGLLVPDAGGWLYVSSTPGAVSATYDDVALTWTVVANGLTSVLAPSDEADWYALGVDPVGWHLVHQADAAGNAVDLTWTGNRLDALAYGGPVLTGDLAFVYVDLTYEPAAATSYRAVEGWLEVIDERLSAVDVSTTVDGVTSTPTGWSFTYATSDGEDRVVAVQQVDHVGAEDLLLASLVWSDWDQGSMFGLAGEDSTPRVLSHCQTTNTVGSCFGGVADLSGDGLLDFTMGGTAGWQTLADDYTSDWSIEGLLSAGADFNDNLTVPVAGGSHVSAYGSYTASRLIDLDGDGFQDIVSSWVYVPLEISFDSNGIPDSPPTDAANAARGDFTWQVAWGSADGPAAAVDFPAPFQWSQISTNPLITLENDADLANSYHHFSGRVDLMDFNGDGWADIVEVLPGPDSGVFVWLKEPSRAAGWAPSPVDLLAGHSDLALRVGSLEHSIGTIDSVSVEIALAAGPVYSPHMYLMETLEGFRDMNGDGLTDYVDASEFDALDDPVWRVFLGTGAGFDPVPLEWSAPVGVISRGDEGLPRVVTCSINIFELTPAIAETLSEIGGYVLARPSGGGCADAHPGYPQQLLISLVDVDADGRLDLLDLETRLWYRNLGDGFDLLASTVPGWFPEEISTSRTVQISASANTGTAAVSSTDKWQVSALTDLNGDGLLDRVLADDPDVVGYFAEAEFGVGVPAGLLVAVNLGTGAETTLGWQSSTHQWPSGDPSGNHRASVRRDLLASLHTIDPIVGQEAITTFTYEDGVCAGGVCQGFERRITTEERLDADYLVRLGAPALLSETTTSYELSRDHALPVEERVETDHAGSYLPTVLATPPDFSTRYRTVSTYADYGSAPPYSRWLTSREVTEYGENSDPGNSRTFVVTVSYDAVGNVVQTLHDAAGEKEDVTIDLTWAVSADDTSWVLTQADTTGFDPASGTAQLIESGKLTYDGLAFGAVDAGFKTGELVCGGLIGNLCANAELLEWSLYRTARGVIDERHAPGGESWYALLLDWGGLVPVIEANALGHETARTLDSLGRVVEVTDPNGVLVQTFHDGFGRPSSAWRAGARGDLLQTDAWTYEDLARPRWVRNDRFMFADPAAVPDLLPSYEVLDGFGRVAQTWRPDETDAAWIVQETETDVAGNVVATTYPHRASVFSGDYAATRNVAILMRRWFDGVGLPRVSYEDHTLDVGRVLTSYVNPGEVTLHDQTGWASVERSDTHGRLLQVEQGFIAGPMAVVGSTAYDGRGRPARLVNGAGESWRYTWDGAGRLRSTNRRDAGGGSDVPYTSYVYEGPRPIRMYEESALLPPREIVRWEYDTLGRLRDKAVLSSTGNWQHWQIGWDSRWLGQMTFATDPNGRVDWYYDDEAFGGFGHVTANKRTFNGIGAVPRFDMTHDFAGREVERSWPSGVTVRADLSGSGYLMSHTLNNAALPAVSYSYDTLGLLAGWEASSAFGGIYATLDRLGPTRLSSLQWIVHQLGGGIVAERITWRHHSNGLLEFKQVLPLEPLYYFYDKDQRIERVRYDVSDPQERYQYDAVGNLTYMWRKDEGPEYNYTPANRFSEVPGRTQVGGPSDTQTWDPWGRMLTWATSSGGVQLDSRTYTYDGAARLTRVVHSPTGQVPVTTTYGYDADDKVAKEVRQVGVGATTTIYRFGDWRMEQGNVIEPILPMLRLEGGVKRWVMLEPDGHAMRVYDDAGVRLRTELTGAQGVQLDQFSVGTVWPTDGQHGDETDRDVLLINRGARTTLLRDGTWLQPEPMLYLAPMGAAGINPTLLHGVYAGGNTNHVADADGYNPVAAFAIWEAFDVGVTLISMQVGVVSAVASAVQGDTDGVIEAGIALGADAASLGSPLPSVAGGALGAMKGAALLGPALKKVDDALEAVGDALGASKSVDSAGKPSFVTDPSGNTLVVPAGGSVTGSPDGSFVQTRRPDGSIYQRKDSAHDAPASGKSPSSQDGTAPHGHGQDADGNSLDVNGNVVD